MSIIKDKDIIDRSIPATKLQDRYTIQGDITQSNLELYLDDINIILSIERLSTATARLGIRTISGTSVVSVNRVSHFDIVSPEGYTENALNVTETVSYVVDTLVYTNSNDISQIEIAKGEIWYTIRYFCSNNGSNSRMNITKN